MSLGGILAPILLSAAFLCLGNFFIVSEVSTHSHLTTSLLKNELRSINPLLLLHNKHLMKLKGIFFQAQGPSKIGEFANDVLIALPNHRQNRINVMLAKNLLAEPASFLGQEVAFFSSLDADSEEKYDHMIVENYAQVRTTAKDFSQMMQKKVWELNNDHLSISLLLVRLSQKNALLAEAKNKGLPSLEVKPIKKEIGRIYAEIVRRFSVAFAAFTFTLMGASFGISISRNHSNRGIFLVILLAALYLTLYMIAKGVTNDPIAAISIYILPHVLIIAASLWTLNRASRGIE
jgi:lipopolysaccharide export system permease protein